MPLPHTQRPFLKFLLVFVLTSCVQLSWANEALTARIKALVRDFYTTVLIGRDVEAAPRFLWPDYIQHNPEVPTGLKGFMDTLRAMFAQKLPPDYKRELLNLVGENDMVVVKCAKLGLTGTENITRHSDSTCSAYKRARLRSIGMPTEASNLFPAVLTPPELLLTPVDGHHQCGS